MPILETPCCHAGIVIQPQDKFSGIPSCAKCLRVLSPAEVDVMYTLHVDTAFPVTSMHDPRLNAPSSAATPTGSGPEPDSSPGS